MTDWKEDPFDFGADVFNSRDVMERIDYLVDKRDDVGIDSDEKYELRALEGLREDAGDDFGYGMTFINDSYFGAYAEELARDTGVVKDNNAWPYTHIDWDSAADDLKQDYTAFSLNGITFWSNDV